MTAPFAIPMRIVWIRTSMGASPHQRKKDGPQVRPVPSIALVTRGMLVQDLGEHPLAALDDDARVSGVRGVAVGVEAPLAKDAVVPRADLLDRVDHLRAIAVGVL